MDAATQTTPRESQSINNSAMVDKPHEAPKPPATASSDSHFIPRIQEVNGSSESQQQQQQQQQHHRQQQQQQQNQRRVDDSLMAQADQRDLRNDGTSKSDTIHMGSVDGHNNGKTSKTNISGQLGDSDTFLHRSLSDTGTDLDRELQAAVDMMLQGSASIGLPDRSYQFGSASKNMRGVPAYSDTMSHASGGQSDRVFVPGSLRSTEDAQSTTRMQKIWLGSKQLSQKIVDRFSRRREDIDDEDTKSLSSADEPESCKRKHHAEGGDERAADDGETKRLKCVECRNPEAMVNSMALAARGTTATTIPMVGASLANNRFVGPVIRYMQRRPLTSLGIVLGVLLSLLTIIIVILVVGVFPFLMRSTLQDLSLSVNSVRASAPPQVSRALKLSNNGISGSAQPFVHRLYHNARMADEPILLGSAANINVPIRHGAKVLLARNSEQQSSSLKLQQLSSVPMSLATQAHVASVSPHAQTEHASAEHKVRAEHPSLAHSPSHVDHASTEHPSHVDHASTEHPSHLEHASLVHSAHADHSSLVHSVHADHPSLVHTPAHMEQESLAPPVHARLATAAASGHPPGMSENHEVNHHPKQRIIESHASSPTLNHLPATTNAHSSLPLSKSIANTAKEINRGPVQLPLSSSVESHAPASNGDSSAHRAMHTETKIVFPSAATPATPAPPPGMVVIPNVAQPTSAPKALDTTVPTSTYMLQIAGNMTSGGPIGVDIEFTEPLRLYWGDAEIGSVATPGSIHVPGRGTSQWSWPAVEVSIPATSGSKSAAVVHSEHDHSAMHSLTDKRFFVTHTPEVESIDETASRSLVQVGLDKMDSAPSDGAMAAQRRVINGNVALGRSNAEELGGGSHEHLARRDTPEDSPSSSDLTSWFAAIRDNRPVTMLWRSRVKITALGLHAKDIKFEKVVRVQCDNSKNCVVTNDSPSS
ncbi:hypothetical protein LPJ59_002640 [Coemansia sp. RSA 2399]|nr:hypothetical protein LPJ59_002640 [Coemansia sp. RSA 2399]KAJ1904778.1 hypothetical protein LPJ81_002297 [Coemansia sp. IMI 209127]